MITHFLWKEKPRIALPTTSSSVNFTYWERPRHPPITSQEELDKYWLQRPINIPSFIKWGSGRSLTDKSDLAAVGVIIGKCTNFNGLEYNYNKEPRTILMFNCSQYAQLAARWETLDDWMPITNEEYKLLVEPNYDDISAKIKHWQEVQQDRLARSS